MAGTSVAWKRRMNMVWRTLSRLIYLALAVALAAYAVGIAVAAGAFYKSAQKSR